MKAKLRINYNNMKKGEVYNFRIINDKIVNCNGIDFGWKEIQPLKEETTYFEIGCYIWIHGKKDEEWHGTQALKRQLVKSVLPSLTIEYKHAALDYYLNN